MEGQAVAPVSWNIGLATQERFSGHDRARVLLINVAGMSIMRCLLL